MRRHPSSRNARGSRRREHGDLREMLRGRLEELVDAGFLEAKTGADGQRMYRKPPGLSHEEWLEAVDRWRDEQRNRGA
jgi:hypothetical protein